MKIDLNLAQPQSRAERWLFFWAPLLIALTAAALVWVLIAAGREFRSYRQAHRTVLRYTAEIGEMHENENRAQAMLRQPPTLALYRQIGFLNALIEQKKVSLASLTLEVTRLLPPQTRLAGLSLVQSDCGPFVELSIEGNGSAAVYSFLSRIEASPDFDAVTVTDQSFATQPQEKGLVTLTCSARYVGVAQTPAASPSERAERKDP
ncbi:MAG: hypothetical protein ACRD1N_07935 [Terriglobia bacterium]